MAKENRILFVEGSDDQHTIWAICENFKIEETFIVEIPDSKGLFNKNAKAHEKGGIDNVLKSLQANLNGSLIERLGIVIDADEDLNLRWQKVLGLLKKLGYENLSELPDKDGTVIEQNDKPRVGVWIMPDNIVSRGMLEDFLQFLVPEAETNPLWDKAVQSSQEVLDEIEEEKRFSEIHLSKARIHTYLAWQKDCGVPFGLSITKKYLQAEKPECQNFVNWLKRLFID